MGCFAWIPKLKPRLRRGKMLLHSSARPTAWEQCPHCKELFGDVYDKRIQLSAVLESSTRCARCWALGHIIGHVTDLASASTVLVGSIWHDNTLEIGVIGPGDTFETAPGYKIYDISDRFKGERRRLDPILGLPIAPKATHVNFRPIGATPEERFGLAKDWLSECVTSHETCNQDDAQYVLPRRLLDISDSDHVRLINTLHQELHPRTAYVALSYCWGKQGNLCTITTNLKQHTAGIPMLSLPSTIRDAVIACKHLGQRYLWVDALCIIQDNLHDKMAQIPQMADIYSGALLVLSAAGSSGSLEGCPLGPLEMQPSPPKLIELDYPLQSNDTEELAGYRVNVVVEQMEHERCRSLPGHWARETFDQDPTDALNVIEERGWTFQERFLAKRSLYIGKGEMSWTCATEVQCECRKPSPSIMTEAGDRVFTRRYGINHMSVNRLFSEAELSKTYSYLWTEIITTYSARLLTQFGDRVAALEGIAVALQRKWPEIYKKDEYFFGCWLSLLPDLLLWHASGEPVSEHISPDLFPSWSWPSCGRPITFMSWMWYGVNPKLWVELLDFEVKPPPPGAVFGQGGGTVTLRGPLIPVKREVVVYDGGFEEVEYVPIDTQLSFMAGGASMDHDDQGPNGDGVSHLALVGSYPFKLQEKSKMLSCAFLCVAPVEGRQEVFRRVGLAIGPRTKQAFLGHDLQRLLTPHIMNYKLV
ncbi:heterokaryon incompatibility protein-domain-containing protein [Cercophora samala]|uniref:Heterokaryon incompatibility protein-domain-containing protein n=1 Tax=Cercophora samala TaxID=330535 RepID=A0AA39ZK80_9PEZI|nr:heterokaryon incompatibility protein-domain-containing protein [Cercophora samala]